MLMPTDLSEDALFTLNILYSNRCFRDNRGYNEKKLKKILSKKRSRKYEDIVKELLNQGYITQINKKDIKYYISDIKKAIYALDSNGFPVTKGKMRKL